MLIRHILSYLLARGVPGIVNFLALAIYTRLLTSQEFGRYSIALAGVGLVQVVIFQWLKLVCSRFVQAHLDEPQIVQRPVLALFLVISGVVGIVALGATLIWAPPAWRLLLFIAIVLTIADAWHELNLSYAAAQLTPMRYGFMSGLRALTAIALGAALAWAGWGTSAPLIGLTVGAIAAWLLVGRAAWIGVRPRWPSAAQAHSFASYGLPLAAVFSLVWVTSSSDRLMIAAMLGEEQTGFYAAGYDLAQQTLILLLSIVNTAATPLAIRLLETGGPEAAREQMRQNGQIMFALAFCGAAGLIAAAPAIVNLFVGEAFRAGALTVFPWIAASAAVVGLKSFYFDIAFHLVRQSKWLLLTSGLAAITNVLLNLLLIPVYGIVGAAWSALAAYLVATISSYLLGRRIFPMPQLSKLMIHGALPAVLVFIVASLPINAGWISIGGLVVSVSSGFLVGVGAMFILNTADIRNIIATHIHI